VLLLHGEESGLNGKSDSTDLTEPLGSEILSAGRAKIVTRPAGVTVIVQGDSDDSFYVILRGRVVVTKLFEGGDEKYVRELGKGDYFGEFAALDPAPRSATVRTLEDSEFAVISRDDLLAVLDRSGDLAMRLITNLIRRTRRDDLRLDSRQPVSERLRDALRDLCEGTHPADAANLRVTRAHLAARCDADVKTISRELTKLEGAGVIRREGRSIRVDTRLLGP
jgi:CRP/FNR family cyclic AMP-dependent transcriptional regulator